jgi:Ca-activated chloride channel family protein
MKRLLVVSFAALLPVSPLSAQRTEPPATPPQQRPAPPSDVPRFSAEISLVNVSFSVHDRNGALLANLGKDDFRLYEDGVLQQPKFFSHEQDSGLTLGLTVDCSNSQRGLEEENLGVALAFLRRVLRPAQDRVFVAGFARHVLLVCPPTASFDRLEEALGRLRDRTFQNAVMGSALSGPSGNSAVFDGIYWPARKVFEGLAGRKALIMIGDGRENVSGVSLYDTIELLQSGDVIFYGLDNGGTSDLNHPNQMPRIATETGGREFKVEGGTGRRQQSKLQQAFDEIERELRAMYSIAYVSTNPARNGKFRRIEVRAVNAAHKTRARPGYYAR